MLSIQEARDKYNKKKSNGAIVGMNAFNHYLEKDLLTVARKLATQSNRQYKNMLSHNYKSPAILGYYRANTGNRSDHKMDPTEMYNKGKISINKNMNKRQLMDAISHSLFFMNAKTHTVSGYKNVLDKAKVTLKEKTGVDLTNLTMDETAEFWNRYNQLLEEGKQFAVENNSMGSPTNMKRIDKYKEEYNLNSLLDAMEKMNDDMEAGIYEDIPDEPDTDDDEEQTEGIWFS